MTAERYDMPITFGPSLTPDRSEVRDAEVVAVSFETTSEGAAVLLPRGIVPAERPVLSMTRITYPSVEYLGGRGYREIVVAVAARFEAADGVIVAGYAPVMWVDRAGALIAGREYMGFAKLLGEMGEIKTGGDTRSFDCREEGALLLEAEASNLKPLPEEKVARINENAGEVVTLGWKHIPSAEGRPDADYPLANVTRWTYREAWSGDSALTFHRRDPVEAPFSSRVIAGMARVPLLWPRPAFVATGDVIIDRAATRRLVGA
jgi:acetoacetate decarboxylase